MVELILCMILGTFGVHKFYRGQIFMGIAYLFTGGLCGFGVIFDAIVIIARLIKKK